MIHRTLTSKIRALATKFPVVVLVGPRQSGKTTLVTRTFRSHDYVSLEDLDVREYAEGDPRAFLADHPGPAILDEVQRAPSLFSYLQTHVDSRRKNGQYILTGSQNVLLQHNVSQTLAGRAAYVTVLPFSLEELEAARRVPRSLDACLFQGFHPRLYDQRIQPTDWFPNYLRTYVEREVRILKNVTDLSAFQRFVRLCAGRIGQMVNLSSLANDAGVAPNTVSAWLSVLEAGYIVFLLRPFHANVNKRLVKSPKLYFYDTGLACALLGIKSPAQAASHYLRGGLFENLVITEVMKFSHHRGQEPSCYFLRDKMGREIDGLVETPEGPWLIEAKSGRTPSEDYFRSFRAWEKAAGMRPARRGVIYGGLANERRGGISLVGWRGLPALLRQWAG